MIGDLVLIEKSQPSTNVSRKLNPKYGGLMVVKKKCCRMTVTLLL